MTTLFVNACIRGERSRTLRLCREYLKDVADVQEVNLVDLTLPALYDADFVDRRAQLEADGQLDDPMFDLARQFAEADEVVIGAPYWDLSFPAALKVYIEHVSVCELTFHYTEDSRCEGLCKAKRLVYLTTGGGPVEAMNFGYEYLCGIARMFGIPKTAFACAENLDVVGIDVEAEMQKALAKVAALKA